MSYIKQFFNKLSSPSSENIEKKEASTDVCHPEEQQTKKIREMFLSNLSHELLSPLNSITGTIDLLSDFKTEEDFKEYISILKKASSQLLNVTNDILDFSLLETGKLTRNNYGYDLTPFLSQIFKSIEEVAEKHSSKFIHKISNPLPIKVVGDKEKISKIIKFISSTAIKSSLTGSDIYGDISFLDSQLIIKFTTTSSFSSDSLVGQNLANNLSWLRKFSGTSLCVPIAIQLAQFVDADINIQQDLDNKFSFILSFRIEIDKTIMEKHLGTPIVETSNSNSYVLNTEEDKKDSESLDNKEQTIGANILLVEDLPINQRVTSHIITKLGHKIDIADNGKIALDMLAKNHYDLVLMDIHMPEMDGITATKIIREQEKGSEKHIPIIALTAKVLAGDKEDCLQAGMDDHISKPVSKDDISAKLNKFLKIG